MSNEHNTIKIGYYREATPGVDPGGANPSKFGITPQEVEQLPYIDYILNSWFAGTREPEIRVEGADPKFALPFGMFNMLPFFFWGATVTEYFKISGASGNFSVGETVTGAGGATAVVAAAQVTNGYGDLVLQISSYTSGNFNLGEVITGSVSTETATLVAFAHVMTFSNEVDHTDLTVRFQSDGSDTQIRKSSLGNKIKNLNLNFNGMGAHARRPVIMAIGGLGLDIDDPTTSGDLTYQAPESHEELYYFKSSDTFKWDYTADDIDYTSRLLDFKYIGDSETIMIEDDDANLPLDIGEGGKSHVFQFSILRGKDKSIYDDWLAQKAAGYTSTKGLSVSCHSKSGTYYFVLYGDGVYIADLKVNKPDRRRGIRATYDAVCAAEHLTVYSVDPLQGNTYYGV